MLAKTIKQLLHHNCTFKAYFCIYPVTCGLVPHLVPSPDVFESIIFISVIQAVIRKNVQSTQYNYKLNAGKHVQN